MVKTVNQKSFDVNLARDKTQRVKYITERAVFELNEKGIVLTEVAPGIDVKKDILEKMDFTPQIEDSLKIMDKRCFLNQTMGLKFEEERKK